MASWSTSTQTWKRAPGTSALRYPRTHDEWVDLYGWLRDAFVADPYDTSDLKGLHLFRALDDNGDEIAVATRVVQDAQHIINADARALSGGERVTLEAGDGDADLTRAEAIWKRSHVDTQVADWALRCAMLGDLHLEAVRDRDGTARIVSYHPGCVRVDYDVVDPTRIVRAVITIRYFDTPEVSPDGVMSDPQSGPGHLYQRVLTEDTITAHRDGVLLVEESGAHGLGCVPLVHVPFQVIDEPEHGLSAAWQAWRAIAVADSIIAQLHATLNRYADPKVIIKGARLDTGSTGLQFGRWLHGLPSDADVSYLEPSMAGCSSALEVLTAVRAVIREAPEFLFTDAGANASGTALSYRAASFLEKMRPIRARFFAGIATAIQLCDELERGTVHDNDRTMYLVDGMPILPIIRSDEVRTLLEIRQANGMTDADFIRHLQRLDYIDAKHDPDEYAERVRADTTSLVRAIDPGTRETAASVEPDAAADQRPADAQPAVTASAADAAVVQSVALNVAQVEAAMGIVYATIPTEGKPLLPKAQAIAALTSMFGLSDDDARRMVGA